MVRGQAEELAAILAQLAETIAPLLACKATWQLTLHGGGREVKMELRTYSTLLPPERMTPLVQRAQSDRVSPKN